jgi:hypothetical protein
VDQIGVEMAAVPHDGSCHVPHAGRHDAVGEQVHAGPERVARAHGQGVGSVATVRERGVAAPVDHEVAVQQAVGERARAINAGYGAVVGRQQNAGRRGYDELVDGRRNEQTVSVAGVDLAPISVHQDDAPARAVEGRGVQQAIDAPGGVALGGDRRGRHQGDGEQDEAAGWHIEYVSLQRVSFRSGNLPALRRRVNPTGPTGWLVPVQPKAS